MYTRDLLKTQSTTEGVNSRNFLANGVKQHGLAAKIGCERNPREPGTRAHIE